MLVKGATGIGTHLMINNHWAEISTLHKFSEVFFRHFSTYFIDFDANLTIYATIMSKLLWKWLLVSLFEDRVREEKYSQKVSKWCKMSCPCILHNYDDYHWYWPKTYATWITTFRAPKYLSHFNTWGYKWQYIRIGSGIVRLILSEPIMTQYYET